MIDDFSAVAPFRCLAAMPPKGSTRAGILPGCPSPDRGSREAEVGFEPRTFRSRSMKAITSKLSCAGHCRLPGWGPRDGPHQWLETLSDMAQSRFQWRSCIQAIAFNA
ncbi:hypothetical protein CSKR_113920 [Clonorchis sinensis]|uniref:Uncharacterized protein n=1 Tax=Clonorchis sinensis TaxID=79923 RepID=A0A419Q9I8_CLOSI|nr:hypothetical protein CSKR_113920 [Clonorchis sinensis]